MPIASSIVGIVGMSEIERRGIAMAGAVAVPVGRPETLRRPRALRVGAEWGNSVQPCYKPGGAPGFEVPVLGLPRVGEIDRQQVLPEFRHPAQSAVDKDLEVGAHARNEVSEHDSVNDAKGWFATAASAPCAGMAVRPSASTRSLSSRRRTTSVKKSLAPDSRR